MISKILRPIGIVAAALVLLLVGALLFARDYFAIPSAQQVDSLATAVQAKRVLGVFAHPDDEQLVTGLYSLAGDEVYTALVTATRGEAGQQFPVVARQRDLGVVRKAEALKNGFALGIDDQEVWEYPDGGVPDVPLNEITARLRAKIRSVRPDLVVTFWPASGATGHKDHRRMGLATETAVREIRAEVARANDAAGASLYRGPRWIAYVITPPEALRTFGGEIGAFVADNQPVATHAMPGDIAAKLRGWEIHASQADYVPAEYGFPAWLLYLLWDREYYYVVDLDGG